MTLFTQDEPTVIENILECIPLDTPLSEVLEAFSGILASLIINASEKDVEVQERLLQVVQSDIRAKVNGRSH